MTDETFPAGMIGKQPPLQRELLETPAWLWQSPSEEQLVAFYRQCFGDFEGPLLWWPLTLAGRPSFVGYIFLPHHDALETFETLPTQGLKLFVKNKSVADFIGCMPKYLRFLKGIFNCDTELANLPSKEVLLRGLAEGVHKKSLELFLELTMDAEKFSKFHWAYIAYLKHGIREDSSRAIDIIRLFRFYSSRRPASEIVGLDEYVLRMIPGQREIYYVRGRNPTEMLTLPAVKSLTDAGVEVLLCPDPPFDGPTMKLIVDWGGYKLVGLTKKTEEQLLRLPHKQQEVSGVMQRVTEMTKDVISGVSSNVKKAVGIDKGIDPSMEMM